MKDLNKLPDILPGKVKKPKRRLERRKRRIKKPRRKWKSGSSQKLPRRAGGRRS